MFNSFKKFSPTDAETPEQDEVTPSYSNTTTPTSVRAWQPEPQEPAMPAHTPLSSTIQRAQPTRNVLNSDVEVIGTLRFQDDLLIDGIVEGKISSEGTLTIGQNARIQAEVKTKSVIIHGKVIGNITVSERVELKATAELVGDIQAASFSVESGAIFIGHSTVGAPSMEIPSKTKKTVKQATLSGVADEAPKPAPKEDEAPVATTPEMQF